MPQKVSGFRVRLNHGMIHVHAQLAVATDCTWHFLSSSGKTIIEIPTSEVVGINTGASAQRLDGKNRQEPARLLQAAR